MPLTKNTALMAYRTVCAIFSSPFEIENYGDSLPNTLNCRPWLAFWVRAFGALVFGLPPLQRTSDHVGCRVGSRDGTDREQQDGVIVPSSPLGISSAFSKLSP